MKKIKLDMRYTATRKWGFEYCVTFPAIRWRDYFYFKSQAHDLFGPSHDIGNRFLFKDQATFLKSAVWAYKYIRSHKDTFVYFRSEKDADQAVMMFALTRTN